jgi:hypothetical protein
MAGPGQSPLTAAAGAGTEVFLLGSLCEEIM